VLAVLFVTDHFPLVLAISQGLIDGIYRDIAVVRNVPRVPLGDIPIVPDGGGTHSSAANIQLLRPFVGALDKVMIRRLHTHGLLLLEAIEMLATVKACARDPLARLTCLMGREKANVHPLAQGSSNAVQHRQ
jgi:hypothetical protein